MKKFEEEVKKPRTRSLSPLNYKDNLLKELSKAVQENYTKNAQILREHREYIEYLEQELEKSRDSECQANNQASYEYILKCEAEKLLEEKQKQIVALKSQLDSQQSKLLEVPQFVADWYEENKEDLEYQIYLMHVLISKKESTAEMSSIELWFTDEDELNKPLETIFAMKNGYTIAKEKRFYLKNKLTGGYIAQDCYNGTRETYNRHDRTAFAQQEIDSMETGSYEQIEVEK
ncbi:DUF1642 domain-containing protein [Lactococcus garvieae]|uniref:DUF1642 domain-containing protein n=1 Tax=Lactococcus garvieae TaxID=1363 RepID=A0A1I4I595_9LACT|nr:DUF1642 domain-containing protein [Lactococcus garvieae]SFL49612.1 Protein of unknown function [Lactococcus garvieae]